MTASVKRLNEQLATEIRLHQLCAAALAESEAKVSALEAQVESLQNKWASRPLSNPDLIAHNEALEAALREIAAATTNNGIANQPWIHRCAMEALHPFVTAPETSCESKGNPTIKERSEHHPRCHTVKYGSGDSYCDCGFTMNR